jgi:hypothetical protein
LKPAETISPACDLEGRRKTEQVVLRERDDFGETAILDVEQHDGERPERGVAQRGGGRQEPREFMSPRTHR